MKSRLLGILFACISQAVFAGNFMGLGDLAGGDYSSIARAVSADGAVVTGGSFNTHEVLEAYRWTEADGLVGLTGGSDGYAASADGSVIVGETNTAGGIEAFRWTQESGG